MVYLQKIQLIFTEDDRRSAEKIRLLIARLSEHFSLIIESNHPDTITSTLYITSDKDDIHEFNQDVDNKFKKLSLFFQVFYPSIRIEKRGETLDYTIKDVRQNWENMEKYIQRDFSEQENLLSIGLTDIQVERSVFDGFAKLVTWLDDNEARGISGYCAIRDGLSHGALDKKRAYKAISEKFPNTFEFEGLILKRSEKNLQVIKSLLPKILKMIENTFETKFVI